MFDGELKGCDHFGDLNVDGRIVVTKFTTCFNILKPCIQPKERICVFRAVLAINSDCVPKQH
jgi:hypothetical protein